MVRSYCDNEHIHLGEWCFPEIDGGYQYVCGRFPDSWNYLYQGDISNLEIRVFRRRGIPVFTHVRCLRERTCFCGWDECHIDSLVVAVDGACPYNGQAAANRSACGIYFGPNNPYNMSILLPDEYTRDRDGRRVRRAHTNQRAELRAVVRGLKAAKRFCRQGGQWEEPYEHPQDRCLVRHLVIKSDSAYVVDAMAGRNGRPGWMAYWEDNNFHNPNGEPVKNQDLWRLVLSKTDALASMGVTVEFWLVPRSHNREADALANEALRGNVRR